MIVYLLKFTTCLAIFLVFYKLVLENQNMHQFKRYFLLAAVFVAVSIPLITFTTYVEPIISNSVGFNEPAEFSILPQIVEEPTNYVPIILWTLYGLGVLLFGIKFIWNLSKIVFKVKRNPKQKNKSFLYVLLQDLVVPHTFFNYIFLNEQKFETKAIPQEVFWHEEAHAAQKHSLDVLFIELLQVIFWFNPLIYFTKHAIKLNHEFLADQAVLNKGIQPSTYQQILLAFSSNASEPQLANAINYSSIKKRFTVMKTHTSKRNIWMRSFLLLPLVALTLYGFSEKREVTKDIATQSMESSKIISQKNDFIIAEDININILTNGKININAEETTTENFKTELYKFNSYLSYKEREALVNVMISSDSEKLTQSGIESFVQIAKTLKSYGVSSIKFDDTEKYVNNEFWIELYSKDHVNSQGVVDFGLRENMTNENSDNRESLLPILEISFNPYVFKLNGKGTSLPRLKEDFVKASNNEKSDLRIKTVGGIKMSLITEIMDKLKDNLIKIRLDEAAYIIGDTSTNKYQQKATPEEVAEYNKLAKSCNSKLESDHPIIKHKDVKRIEYLYGKMSEEQKKSAQSYPDFSKLPPPPAPETGFIEVNGETLWYVKFIPTEYYNRKGYKVDKYGKTVNGNKQVNASDVLPGQYITKVYQNDKVVVEFKDNGSENIPPPPPPAAKPPFEHLKEMSKKGASFYFEGKSISYEQAVQILKKNNELNISTKQVNTKEPKVYISKEPVFVRD